LPVEPCSEWVSVLRTDPLCVTVSIMLADDIEGEPVSILIADPRKEAESIELADLLCEGVLQTDPPWEEAFVWPAGVVSILLAVADPYRETVLLELVADPCRETVLLDLPDPCCETVPLELADISREEALLDDPPGDCTSMLLVGLVCDGCSILLAVFWNKVESIELADPCCEGISVLTDEPPHEELSILGGLWKAGSI
jgi:hypothetical protein